MPTTKPSGSSVASIIAFLEARIAEDEAEAQKGGYHNASGVFARDNYGCLLIQPSRVLAECAAKRAIIAGRKRIDRSANPDEWSMGYSDANYEAIHALAAVYADHPDYQQEWAL